MVLATELKANPVRDLRLTRGLSMVQFAQLCHISYMTLYRLEHGHSDELPSRFMRALAGAGVDALSLAREYESWKTEQRTAGLQVTEGR